MRMLGKGFAVLMLIALFCATMTAQDNDAPKKPMPSRSIANAKMPPPPQPSPEMTKLIQMMAGNWTVAEKSEPSPMFPTGGTGKGTAKFWAGPGGLSLLETYQSSGIMGTNFKGSGIFWWDPKIQAYHGVWCDSMTPDGCDGGSTFKWDGETLAGMMESDMNGQKMVMKFTYTNWSPNSFVMNMAMGPDANSVKDMMTVMYTKAVH